MNFSYSLKLLIKRLLFPGLDVSTRKRQKFTKYLKTGEISTLDAGCGNGAFSLAAAKLGNRVLGIDFDSQKLARCAEFRDFLHISPARCEFRVQNIYKLTELNQKFDQIICFETLEHLKNDELVLDSFAQILKPGGFLHLCTPTAKRIPYYGEIVSEIEDGGHVRLGYTIEKFQTLLTARGFQILQKDYAVGLLGQYLLNFLNWLDLRAFPNFSKHHPNLLHALFFLPLYPFTFLDKFLPAEPLNVYVLARKI